ncbi:MAG: hypothetical protein ACKPHU_07725, partial [Planctomycetaceae bacterium]
HSARPMSMNGDHMSDHQQFHSDPSAVRQSVPVRTQLRTVRFRAEHCFSARVLWYWRFGKSGFPQGLAAVGGWPGCRAWPQVIPVAQDS